MKFMMKKSFYILSMSSLIYGCTSDEIETESMEDAKMGYSQSASSTRVTFDDVKMLAAA